MGTQARPVGRPTRGTTGYNRLRRSDRWLVHEPRVRSALLAAADPLVVDLGYGALPVTTLELAARLRSVRPDVRVVGLEIDPDRVRLARASAGDATVEFALGGSATIIGARVQRTPAIRHRVGARRMGGDEGSVGTRWVDRRWDL
jgi:hypothetical protein